MIKYEVVMKRKTNIFLLILTVLTAILVMSSCDIVAVIFPCDHSWVDATCKEAKHCEECGEIEGDALGHTPGDEANCTTDQICTVCGDTLVAKHHKPEAVKGYAATCTEEGMSDGEKCSSCGEVVTAQQTIKEKGHTPGAEATCTTDQTCAECGDMLVAKHHTPEEVKGYAATCTVDGLTDGVKCGKCGEVITAQETIKANGHTPGSEATCTTDQTCTECGDILVARHHTPVIIKGYDATCTSTGKTDGVKCDACGRTLTAQATIKIKPHTEEEVPGAAATCYDAGLTAGVKCSACKKTLTTQTTVPATGHNFVDGSCTVCSQGYYNDGMVFILSNDEKYYILDRLGTLEHKDIVIPSTYKGLPVTKIGCNFTRYNNYKSSIETVTIPSSINFIEAGTDHNKPGAFSDCVNIKKVYIESMESWFNTAIGPYYGVANPLHYGAELYCGGELVTEVTIPSSVEQLFEDYFDGCSSITKINFHDRLYVLAGFKNLPNLTEVTIPSCVKIIIGNTFVGCNSLNVINIPDTTYHIFQGAFEGTGYYNNKDNWDGGNVLYVGNHLIVANKSITGEYTVREGTKSISQFAFSSCRNLTKLTLNEELVVIGDNAFSYTSALQSITIPANVRYIGQYAFDSMYANKYGLKIIFNYRGTWYQHKSLYDNLSSSSYVYGSKYNTVVVYYVNGDKITGGTPGMTDSSYSMAISR